MLYIFTFVFMSLTASAAIKCPSDDLQSSKIKLCSESQVPDKNKPVHILLETACVKSQFTARPRVQRASSGSGLSNLFYMMALPVGVHSKTER